MMNNEKYPLLYGFSDNGCFELHGVEELAKFIIKEGQTSDLSVLTPLHTVLLDTYGIYLNRIADMEYRQTLLEVLVPMQQELEDETFSSGHEMEMS